MGRIRVEVWLAAAGMLLVLAGAFTWWYKDSSHTHPPAPKLGKGEIIFRSESLYPRFDPHVHDYVAKCTDDSMQLTVRGHITSVSSAAESLISETELHGRNELEVPLSAGEQMVISSQHNKNYHIRCLPDNFPEYEFDKQEHGPQPAYKFYTLSPSMGDATQVNYNIVFDSNGTPVWWYENDLPTHDFKIFADGTAAFSVSYGGGFGTDPGMGQKLLSLDGSELDFVQTVGSPADHHDFQPALNGKGWLLISFKPRKQPTDLSGWGGPQDATVVDGVFEQINPDGTVAYRWSSKKVLPLRFSKPHQERILQIADERAATGQEPLYDPTHLNSVQQTKQGYLISSRHTNAVYMIDKKSKRVIWKLGGTPSRKRLQITKDPFAEDPLNGQHDARMLADGTVIVYDNASFVDRTARAVRYRIFPKQKKAVLVDQVFYPSQYDSHKSGCCGSSRMSKSGHWIVGWGGTPYSSEFSANGHLIFTLKTPERSSYRFIPVPHSISINQLRHGMDSMYQR